MNKPAKTKPSPYPGDFSEKNRVLIGITENQARYSKLWECEAREARDYAAKATDPDERAAFLLRANDAQVIADLAGQSAQNAVRFYRRYDIPEE